MFNKWKSEKQEYPQYKGDSRWAFMRIRDITIDGNLYIRRLMILKCPWFAIYLHQFFRGDDDRCLHDHPWPFWTFILKHGYKENTPNGVVTTKPWRLYYRPATYLHAVQLEPTDPKPMTLVFVGNKQREWGFLTKLGQWVHWKEFTKNRDAHIC